jgi:hypothetical protein
VSVNGRELPVRRYLTVYNGIDSPPAEFCVAEGGYPLRMISRRRAGESVEIVCKDFRTGDGGEIQTPGDGL